MDKSKARNVAHIKDHKAPASANKESFLNWHERLTLLLITDPFLLLRIFLLQEAGRIKKKHLAYWLKENWELIRKVYFLNIILKGLIVLTLILPCPAGIDIRSSTRKISDCLSSIKLKSTSKGENLYAAQAAMQIFFYTHGMQISVSRGEVLGRSIMLYF